MKKRRELRTLAIVGGCRNCGEPSGKLNQKAFTHGVRIKAGVRISAGAPRKQTVKRPSVFG